MSQRDHTNYYEILEISPDAVSTEIHKAYQRARQTYSQDNPALYSMFSPDEARELLRLIDEAYNVLGNQATRKTYDDSLGNQSGGNPFVAPAPQAMPQSGHSNHQTNHQSSSSSTSASMSSHSKTHSQTYSNSQPSMPPMAQQSSTIGSPASSSSAPPPMNQRNEGFTPSYEMDGQGDFSVKRQTSQRPAMAPGQGRTQLSTFKVDEAFEQEITAATEFDGGFIQRVRLYKNVSIDKMSEATRISRPYLMAVETNDYKGLPAAVFVRGFVVQVSRQLGLDENKVASSYMKLFKAGGGK